MSNREPKYVFQRVLPNLIPFSFAFLLSLFFLSSFDCSKLFNFAVGARRAGGSPERCKADPVATCDVCKAPARRKHGTCEKRKSESVGRFLSACGYGSQLRVREGAWHHAFPAEDKRPSRSRRYYHPLLSCTLICTMLLNRPPWNATSTRAGRSARAC